MKGEETQGAIKGTLAMWQLGYGRLMQRGNIRFEAGIKVAILASYLGSYESRPDKCCISFTSHT